MLKWWIPDCHQRSSQPTETGREEGESSLRSQRVPPQRLYLELRSDSTGKSFSEHFSPDGELTQQTLSPWDRRGRTRPTRTATPGAAATTTPSTYVTSEVRYRRTNGKRSKPSQRLQKKKVCSHLSGVFSRGNNQSQGAGNSGFDWWGRDRLEGHCD